MSIHAIYPCPGCDGSFAFPEQHWPHCPGNPNNLEGSIKKAIESKFTKAELALIANHGPVADKRISRKRSKSESRR